MDIENTVFCQSCAMPINDESLRGTEANGSKSDDYCHYCYEQGAFKGDMNMEQMIDFCAPTMVQYGSAPDVETAKKDMMEYFPKLKRWAK